MKKILITGASGDLGASIAKKIAGEWKKECLIYLHYNSNKNKALKLAEELESNFGCKAEIVQTDLSDISSVQKLCDDLNKKGGVDILINNAAVVVDADLEVRTPEIFEKTLRCNLVAPFILSKELGSSMNKNVAGGAIVNISSTNGIDYNSPYSLDYDASKAGLISLTKNLAMLLQNVNVNCVAPHWMNTQMNAGLEKEFLEEEASKILKGRFAETDEVAEFVWFLISDKAKYLTGQVYSFGSYKY